MLCFRVSASYQTMSLNVKLCLSRSSGIFTRMLAGRLLTTLPRLPFAEAIDTTSQVLPCSLC
jgi:hypothetical protein